MNYSTHYPHLHRATPHHETSPPMNMAQAHQTAPESPCWRGQAASIWSYLCQHDLPCQAMAEEDDPLDLLNLATPFFYYACQKLGDDVGDRIPQNGRFTSDSAVECLADSLARELAASCNRAADLEGHVQVLRGMLSHHPGQSVRRRFLEEQSSSAGRIHFFSEYAVLTRQLVVQAKLWRDTSREFLARLEADSPRLAETLLAANGGALVGVTSLGDRHRGGQTVQSAEFANGEKVIYKPRTLATDALYKEVVDWIFSKGGPDQRVPKCLMKDNYGWMEWIPTTPCETEAEVRRYFERMGAALAIFYVLGTTDLHSENIVACGEHPVLVDMETALSPGPFRDWAVENDVVCEAWTVLRTSLLPHQMRLDGHRVVEESSALGGWDETIALNHGLSDEQSKIMMNDLAKSRPQIDGKPANTRLFAACLVRGFESVYQIVLQHRDEFLSNGPLQRFGDTPIRILLRDTRSYEELLKDRYHPDLLRDAAATDEHFGRLRDGVSEGRLQRIVAAEIRALWDDDIPYFWTTADSTSLWTGDGECIPDVFQSSAMEETCHRIWQLSTTDLKRQVWLIEQCLRMIPAAETRVSRRASDPVACGTSVQPQLASDTGFDESKKTFLEQASRLAERIRQAAFELGGGLPPQWTSFCNGSSKWTMMPGGDTSLISGTHGLALLLGFLGAVTDDHEHTDFARRCLSGPDTSNNRSGFGGLGGTAYVLAHLGNLWGESTLWKRAAAAAREASIAKRRDFDVFNGTAGDIAALISVYRATDNSEFLDAAMACGEYVIRNAISMPVGIGWPSRTKRPLTGYGHGAAGIAWALLKLSEETGEQRYATAAQDGIAYERSLFVKSQGNWQDVRQMADEGQLGEQNKRCALAVCHGAPGIGLARADTLSILDDDITRQEIRIAAESTLARGFGDAHCLCHGDLGNVESLLRCADALGDAELRSRGEKIAVDIVQDGVENGWRCGVPNYSETADFMMGLGGISYTLLRWAAPEQVPFVLTFAT